MTVYPHTWKLWRTPVIHARGWFLLNFDCILMHSAGSTEDLHGSESASAVIDWKIDRLDKGTQMNFPHLQLESQSRPHHCLASRLQMEQKPCQDSQNANAKCSQVTWTECFQAASLPSCLLKAPNAPPLRQFAFLSLRSLGRLSLALIKLAQKLLVSWWC